MKIFPAIKIILLALILSLGISYAFAAWTPPPASPPDGNADAPINVGPLAQEKLGGFALFGDFVYLPSGAPGSVSIGQVLTALDTNGKVGWGATGAGFYRCAQTQMTDGNKNTLKITYDTAIEDANRRGQTPPPALRVTDIAKKASVTNSQGQVSFRGIKGKNGWHVIGCARSGSGGSDIDDDEVMRSGVCGDWVNHANSPGNIFATLCTAEPTTVVTDTGSEETTTDDSVTPPDTGGGGGNMNVQSGLSTATQQNIVFSEPFASPPHVVLTAYHPTITQCSAGGERVSNVTTTGFRGTVKLPPGSYSNPCTGFFWIAVGPPAN